MDETGLTEEESEKSAHLLTAVGNAVLSWQGVEHMVLEVYLCFFDTGAKDPAAIVYHAARTFDTRLGMVGALVLDYASDLQKQDWEKLLKAVRKASQKRNSLAHGVYVIHVQGQSREPMISRSPYDLSNFPQDTRSRTAFVSTKEVNDMVLAFGRVMKTVQDFANQLAEDGGLRARLRQRSGRLHRMRQIHPLRTRSPE